MGFHLADTRPAVVPADAPFEAVLGAMLRGLSDDTLRRVRRIAYEAWLAADPFSAERDAHRAVHLAAIDEWSWRLQAAGWAAEERAEAEREAEQARINAAEDAALAAGEAL